MQPIKRRLLVTTSMNKCFVAILRAKARQNGYCDTIG